ncbi:MAG: class II fructose-bisphosphatase [Myxococcota bacterium]
MHLSVTHAAVRAAQQAALASSEWIGKGEQKNADAAAVKAMRATLSQAPLQGRVVIGEGERDQAPMLFIGEKIGHGGPEAPSVDIAVDPLEGTGLCANDAAGALTLIALAPAGTLLHAPDVYMDKVMVGPGGKGTVALDQSPEENVTCLAKRLGQPPSALTVAILERERHDDLIARVRGAGARVRLIADGDVAAAILACVSGSGIHMVLGSGGAPEGVLAACALKCLGGDMQARLLPKNDAQRQRCSRLTGLEDPTRTLRLEDLVRQEAVFAATGVNSGGLLPGVARQGDHDVMHTLLLSTADHQAQWLCCQHARNPAVSPTGAWLRSPFGAAPSSF